MAPGRRRRSARCGGRNSQEEKDGDRQSARRGGRIAQNRINLCAARGSVRTVLAEAGLRRSAEGKSDRQSPSHSMRMRRSENRSVNHALQWSEMQRLQRNRPAPLIWEFWEMRCCRSESRDLSLSWYILYCSSCRIKTGRTWSPETRQQIDTHVCSRV